MKKQCYLLHFDPPYKHARHYVGYTEHLDVRVEQHRNGTGANLLDGNYQFVMRNY